MKKNIFLFFFLAICFCSAAQQTDTSQKYALRRTSTYFDVTSAKILDNYLSPLPYSGIGAKVTSESVRLFSPDNLNLSSKSRFHINAGTATNDPSTASIMYLGLNYGWGMYYHFYLFENFQILTGGLADIDLLFKYNSRNVNNPVNLDLALNVNAAVSIIYDIPTKKRKLRLQGDFEMPLIGLFFAPQLGSSYYEMFSLGAKGSYVHFGFLTNKVAFRQRYFIEIPFKRSTWRFGLVGENSKHSANDMMFRKNNFGGFLGYTRTLFSFNRKYAASDNFIIF